MKEKKAIRIDSENLYENQFYTALGHEIRRKIIKLIGKNEYVGFSEIKQFTSASTGTIYHHFEVLKELIIQDNQKKYHLTVLGMHAYKFLKTNLDSIESTKSIKIIANISFANKITHLFLFKSLFFKFIKSPKFSVIVSCAIIFIIALLSAIFDIQAYLFFYHPNLGNFISNNIYSSIIIFFTVIFGFLVLFGISELLCRYIFNKKENWKGFLRLIGISYLPILLYIILVVILKSISAGFRGSSLSNFIEFGFGAHLIKVLMVLFQVWSMILLAYIISLTKYVSFERGLIIAVFIDYFVFILMILTNTPIF